MAMPDAAGEVAYTARVFPQSVSFVTGWMMLLAYFIVCPWEAVAVGRIAGYIFPALDSHELYRVAGKPVYLPHLAIGLGLTALVTVLNYRGIRLSAIFQNWTVLGTLRPFRHLCRRGRRAGSPANFPPLFTHTPFVSILLVLQIVPYYMTGFESVTKAAEEASPDFRARGFPDRDLGGDRGGRFLLHHRDCRGRLRGALAGAYWRAIHDCRRFRARGRLALDREHHPGAALLSLFKVFNGNFVAASRLLFAMGRRGLVDPRLGRSASA